MAILHRQSTDRTTKKAKKSPEGQSARMGVIPAAVFLVFSILYCATGTSYNTFDAVSYSNQIAHL